MRRFLPLVLVLLGVFVTAVPAHAALFGVESNGELINSNRTRVQQAQTLAAMKAQGVGLARVDAGWNEVSLPACGRRSAAVLRDPDNGCYNWTSLDGFVQEATARGIVPLVSVSRAPFWLHRTSDPFYVGATSAQFARTVQQYEAFMYAAARRYRPGSVHGTVRLWTVWNEPNSDRFFRPLDSRASIAAAPGRYALMLARTAVAIKTASPTALVAAGPTGPKSTIKPQTFVQLVQAKLPSYLPGTSLYAKRRWISAWAHNPYPGTRSPTAGITRAPSIGLNNINDLFRQLDAAPITRGLKVWATEFGYQTNPPDRAVGVPVALQGRYIGESFDLLASTRRVTVLVWYGFTDPVEPADFQSGTFTARHARKASYYWWQRPISVPTDTVARGGAVRVWARSMVNPRATRISVSTDGRNWQLLSTKGRSLDGTTIQHVRLTRTTYFATYDGARGPSRRVVVR